MSTTASQSTTWKEKTEPYRNELIAGGIIIIAHIVVVSILWEYLAEHFGKPRGFLILISLPAIVFFFFLLRYLIKKLLIKPAKQELKTMMASTIEEVLRKYEDRILRPQKDDLTVTFENMQRKYQGVHFNALRSTNEFTTKGECDTVKVGLMKGVQKCVHAIHQIEPFLPLPGDSPDDYHYFHENIEARKRIRKEHDGGQEYDIHRIFVISEKALEDQKKAEQIKEKIKEHSDVGFDVKVVLKEKLEEPLTFEFGIYDDEIVFRLSINYVDKKYGEGVVYFNKDVLNDVYKKRFDEIGVQSLKPDDFWKKYPLESFIKK
jgi:hypothetical protein